MGYAVSPSRPFRLKISHIFFTGLIVLTLSYNFHALWLIYDLGSILLIGYFIQSRKFSLSLSKVLLLLIVCAYFSFNIVRGGHYLEGILSLWDTLKHIPYIMYAAWFLKFNSSFQQDKVLRKLYLFLLYLFFIQTLFVVIQFSTGVFFDDIAGTFGDGGSHAIGYLSLLTIAASQCYSKKIWLKMLILLLSVMMNILSENAGFFVLLMILVVGILMSKKITLKMGLILPLLLLLLYPILSVKLYSEKAFFTVISQRLVDITTLSSSVSLDEAHTRSGFLLIASFIGDWFGAGVGSFSSIYMLEGSGVQMLNGIQINITEASHLIAESGFMGFLLISLTYISFIKDLDGAKKQKIYYVFLFLVCMFYSAVLMNESHTLLLLLTFVFVSKLSKQKVEGYGGF